MKTIVIHLGVLANYRIISKAIYTTVVVCLPVFLSAQSNNTEGIQFEQNLSWSKIKSKAKEENKFIFVDLYATWCGPCKTMDKLTYTDKSVGDFFNSRFISVKVQMDKTANDDSSVKKWYNDAVKLGSDYTISVYPTFLFFSPDGKPIHKTAGYKDAAQFVAVGNDVFNPQKQFYNVLRNFRAGTMDTLEMKGLARSFFYSDKVLAGKIAADYLIRIPSSELHQPDNVTLLTQFSNDSVVLQISLWYLKGLDRKDISKPENFELLVKLKKLTDVKQIAKAYIDHLSRKQRFTSNNIYFIAAFTNASIDEGFEMFYQHSNKIFAATKDSNLSRSMVNYIVTREEIDSKLWKSNYKEVVTDNPDWSNILMTITQKYKKISKENVERLILDAKLKWYGPQKRNWPEFTRTHVFYLERYLSSMNDIDINQHAWAIFQYSNNKEELEKALRCISKFVTDDKLINPAQVSTETDTYANILYKLGHKNEAIEWETKALEYDQKSDPKMIRFQKVIDQMKAEKKTWIINLEN